ncbi:TPA: hypothetical protein ACQ31I_004258 [Yersinia enterocolitica]
MDFKRRLALYEKLYFNENETKEKLHARVQGVFAFALIIATVISYIFKNISYDSTNLTIIITLSNVIASLFLLHALLLLKKAFWGNEYATFFTPQEISELLEECKNYNKKLVEYNLEYPYCSVEIKSEERRLDEIVYEKFESTATHNIEVNYIRSEHIHKAIHKMFVSLIPLTFGMAVFLMGNLDGSAPRNTSSSESKIIVIDNSHRI